MCTLLLLFFMGGKKRVKKITLYVRNFLVFFILLMHFLKKKEQGYLRKKGYLGFNLILIFYGRLSVRCFIGLGGRGWGRDRRVD